VLSSYILRLIPSELARGRLVGEVEDVSTGKQRAIRDAAELISFCSANSSVDDEPETAE
jgi:hypothetical protein